MCDHIRIEGGKIYRGSWERTCGCAKEFTNPMYESRLDFPPAKYLVGNGQIQVICSVCGELWGVLYET